MFMCAEPAEGRSPFLVRAAVRHGHAALRRDGSHDRLVPFQALLAG